MFHFLNRIQNEKKNSFEIYEIFLTINKIMKILFDWRTDLDLSPSRCLSHSLFINYIHFLLLFLVFKVIFVLFSIFSLRFVLSAVFFYFFFFLSFFLLSLWASNRERTTNEIKQNERKKITNALQWNLSEMRQRDELKSKKRQQL